MNELQGPPKVNNLHPRGGHPPKKQDSKGDSPCVPCYRCGKANHKAVDCYFREATCNHCGKKGHLARVCRSRASQPQNHKPGPHSGRQPKPANRAHHLENSQQDGEEVESDEYTLYPLYTLSKGKTKPMLVTVSLNGSGLEMAVDTGASLSVISTTTYHRLWPASAAPVMHNSDAKLAMYTGESIPIAGAITVQVAYQDQEKELELLVVQGGGPSLLGRD